jgi:predicted Abi (CAAX) family protease
VKAAITTHPGTKDWRETAALLLLFALLALPLGLQTGFFHPGLSLPWKTAAGILLISLLLPAAAEELVFRVLLLPHPQEKARPQALWLGGVLSWSLYVASHPLKLFSLWGADRAVFAEPVFLVLTGLLGIACTLAYLRSGSLWPPVALHWAAVVIWLLLLGGYRRLHP